MKMKNTLKCQWTIMKRYKTYFIISFLLYFVAAFFDLKNKIFMPEVEDFIYRYNFQQILIVFSNIMIVSLLINEEFLRLYEIYFSIYIKNRRAYFYCILLLLILTNIVPFFIGQILCLTINYIHFGTVPIILFFVNLSIVFMEIIISVFLAMGLNLLLKKNILVYLIYYIIIVALLAVNNVYISIPLSIGILSTQAYYTTFALPLWLGRCILIILSGILFYLSVEKFIRKKY